MIWPAILLWLLAASASSLTEQFASTNTGPATSILRTFDAYGELATESVNGGPFAYGTTQGFDLAGRRLSLAIGGVNYAYGWRADGLLASASDSFGGGVYSYDTSGLLTNRLVSQRSTSTTFRDGEGRPLAITTTVNGVPQLTESLTWLGDGLLAANTLTRPDFTDSRSYAYANQSRRLAQEQLNLNATNLWTNNFTYDSGVAAGPGVLTSMGAAGGAASQWNGGADAFSRVSAETNNTILYSTYGHINGQATLSLFLDAQPLSVAAVGTNAMLWNAQMELTPGIHQLTATALHPGGLFTAYATNTFTNSIPSQTTGDTFDYAGNITQRVWLNANGTTNRIQTLAWDARGRLHAVTERDANNSGYNWTATYDGLSRRLSTTSIMVTNGFALSTLPTTINSYYDPQVEFLELGVAYGATTTWKLYGPDLNGRYGGLNGTGGYDADSPGLNLFNPTLSDFRGNILGYYNSAGGSNVWNAARPTGYGAVPGYRPVALANSANVPQASAWRGHWPDITGYYHIGLRDLYPVSGGWLSSDSIWNERDPNWYTFAGGDPVNHGDWDGRLGKDNLPQNLYFGTAPVMATSIQPTLYLYDGTVIPPNPNGNLVDPGQVASYTYNLVTQPTGQSFSFISPVPLPDGYGQSTSVPITHADQEMQQGDQFLKFVATAALSEVGSEFLLGGGALAAEETHTIFENAPSGFSNGNLAQQAHDNFQQALNDLYGTQNADWRMATAPGQTGVDATYVGPASRNPGFNFGELKPYSENSLGTFGNQLGNWGLPEGQTELFFYNKGGVIGSSGFKF